MNRNRVTLVEVERPAPSHPGINAEISRALDTFLNRLVDLGFHPEGVMMAVVLESGDVIAHETVSQIVTKSQENDFVKNFLTSITSHTIEMVHEIDAQN